MMARHGTEARKSGVPFAPFLALGGLVGLLAGPELIELYTTRFLGLKTALKQRPASVDTPIMPLTS